MEPRPTDLERRISSIAALDQPLRRDLYRLLSSDDGWVTRDEASEALGIARSVAAFHLDKLADAGVAEITFERTTGRTGPGAGRPSKLYRRVPGRCRRRSPNGATTSPGRCSPRRSPKPTGPGRPSPSA